MHAKTVEGLVGARMYMNLTDTPMRIFKEASHRGDTAAMERSMGYAGKFTDKAGDYKSEADEGMKKDAEEAKEKAEEEREKAAQKREEERIRLEKRIEEAGYPNADKAAGMKMDTVEVSEEGRALQMESTDALVAASDGETAGPAKEPVIYTKTGETGRQEPGAAMDVSC